MNSTVWLSPDEQQSWRALLELSSRIVEGIDADVEPFDLTGADFEVLVHLSESADGGLRMSELASRVLVSKSRMTYRVDRLEASGYVVRESCATDRRGFIARITPAGRNRLEEVAPHHVAGVRGRVLDHLTPREFAQLGTLASKVLRSSRPATKRRA